MIDSISIANHLSVSLILSAGGDLCSGFDDVYNGLLPLSLATSTTDYVYSS